MAISGATLFNDYLRGAAAGTQMKDGRDTCYSVRGALQAGRRGRVGGLGPGPSRAGPKYETIVGVRFYCDVADMGAIVYANQLCNEYGVDTISAGPRWPSPSSASSEADHDGGHRGHRTALG